MIKIKSKEYDLDNLDISEAEYLSRIVSSYCVSDYMTLGKASRVMKGLKVFYKNYSEENTEQIFQAYSTYKHKYTNLPQVLSIFYRGYNLFIDYNMYDECGLLLEVFLKDPDENIIAMYSQYVEGEIKEYSTTFTREDPIQRIFIEYIEAEHSVLSSVQLDGIEHSVIALDGKMYDFNNLSDDDIEELVYALDSGLIAERLVHQLAEVVEYRLNRIRGSIEY